MEDQKDDNNGETQHLSSMKHVCDVKASVFQATIQSIFIALLGGFSPRNGCAVNFINAPSSQRIVPACNRNGNSAGRCWWREEVSGVNEEEVLGRL